MIHNISATSAILEIHNITYVRLYVCICVWNSPAVNYKETVTARSLFTYLHKKQSGGSGQYAKVIGYIEPLDEDELKKVC